MSVSINSWVLHPLDAIDEHLAVHLRAREADLFQKRNLAPIQNDFTRHEKLSASWPPCRAGYEPARVDASSRSQSQTRLRCSLTSCLIAASSAGLNFAAGGRRCANR